MKIAVTFENGNIGQHFGKTQWFKVYEVSEGQVTSAKIYSTGGQGHGALASVLKALGADVLICGGMGAGAKNALANIGVAVCGGVNGNADEAVANYLAGKLDYSAEANCNHHGDHHRDHECGDNGCGSHGCNH